MVHFCLVHKVIIKACLFPGVPPIQRDHFLMTKIPTGTKVVPGSPGPQTSAVEAARLPSTLGLCAVRGRQHLSLEFLSEACPENQKRPPASVQVSWATHQQSSRHGEWYFNFKGLEVLLLVDVSAAFTQDSVDTLRRDLCRMLTRIPFRCSNIRSPECGGRHVCCVSGIQSFQV